MMFKKVSDLNYSLLKQICFQYLEKTVITQIYFLCETLLILQFCASCNWFAQFPKSEGDKTFVFVHNKSNQTDMIQNHSVRSQFSFGEHVNRLETVVQHQQRFNTNEAHLSLSLSKSHCTSYFLSPNSQIRLRQF